MKVIKQVTTTEVKEQATKKFFEEILMISQLNDLKSYESKELSVSIRIKETGVIVKVFKRDEMTLTSLMSDSTVQRFAACEILEKDILINESSIMYVYNF